MIRKTATEMRPILKAYAGYSGTKKAFCQDYGIKLHVLSYWLQKSRKPTKKPVTNKFIPLQIEKPTVSPASTIELYYPNGLRLVLPTDTSLKVLQGLIKMAH